MNKLDFDKILYRKPHRQSKNNAITDFIGLDTEAYNTGEPFIYCLSDGTVLYQGDIPRALFTPQYLDKHFVVFNLRYESGALTYHLPMKCKRELKDLEKTEYDGYKYAYLPHKRFRITKNNNGVTFWDISQFYHMPLNNAAKEFLGKRKIEIETLNFTPQYVIDNKEKIIRYCIRDAQLTRELALYFLKYIGKFGIRPNNLYSPASISFTYFKQQGRIVDVWYYWRKHREVLRYACQSYYGGKFEITQRGKFTGYEYDINSAYPYEIANLIDTRDGIVRYSKQFIPEAVYGFIKCHVRIPSDFYHTLTIKDKGMNYYPCGDWTATITMREYEYLIKCGIKVKHIDGYYILVRDISYPYRQTVNKLYRIKEDYKVKDITISRLAKIMLNSFYGKMCQLIERPDGAIEAGSGWHEIYASVITANVRLRVAEVQNRLKDSCICVHTDSAITTEPLPETMLGSGLGAWELKTSGVGMVIMSGMYQIGDKIANRGFTVQEGFTWLKLATTLQNESTHTFKSREVRSWIEAVQLDREQEINLFIDDFKVLDLNKELKRVWEHKTSGTALLSGLERSLPRVYFGKQLG